MATKKSTLKNQKITMNAIFKKVIAELLRAVLAAFLAALGIEATGCVAHGDHATASFISENGNK